MSLSFIRLLLLLKTGTMLLLFHTPDNLTSVFHDLLFKYFNVLFHSNPLPTVLKYSEGLNRILTKVVLDSDTIGSNPGSRVSIKAQFVKQWFAISSFHIEVPGIKSYFASNPASYYFA